MNLLMSFILFGMVMTSMCDRADWLNKLLGDINKMNIHLQQNLQKMNEKVHSDVHTHLVQVDKLREDLHKRIASLNEHSMTLASNGKSIVVNGNGEMKTLLSGRNSNSQTYFRETEDKVENDILIHSEKIYIPGIKDTTEFKYKINLKDLSVEPIIYN